MTSSTIYPDPTSTEFQQRNDLDTLPTDTPARKNRPSLHRPGFISEIFQTIIFVIAVTVLFDMAIPRSLIQGISMQPTYVEGERLVVSRLNYMVSPPDRGDIFVFNSLVPPSMTTALC